MARPHACSVGTILLAYALLVPLSAATAPACADQSRCLNWHFGDCDGWGMRHVCMLRNPQACAKAPEQAFAEICSQTATAPGTVPGISEYLACQRVEGGAEAVFGVRDGAGCPGGADDGTYPVATSSGVAEALCTAASVCPGKMPSGHTGLDCQWTVAVPNCPVLRERAMAVQASAQLGSCASQAACLQWAVGDCDAYGKRRVCMERRSITECAKAAAEPIPHVCQLDGGRFKIGRWRMDDERTVCYEVSLGYVGRRWVLSGDGCTVCRETATAQMCCCKCEKC